MTNFKTTEFYISTTKWVRRNSILVGSVIIALGITIGLITPWYVDRAERIREANRIAADQAEQDRANEERWRQSNAQMEAEKAEAQRIAASKAKDREQLQATIQQDIAAAKEVYEKTQLPLLKSYVIAYWSGIQDIKEKHKHEWQQIEAEKENIKKQIDQTDDGRDNFRLKELNSRLVALERAAPLKILLEQYIKSGQHEPFAPYTYPSRSTSYARHSRSHDMAYFVFERSSYRRPTFTTQEVNDALAELKEAMIKRLQIPFSQAEYESLLIVWRNSIPLVEKSYRTTENQFIARTNYPDNNSVPPLCKDKELVAKIEPVIGNPEVCYWTFIDLSPSRFD